MSPGEPLDFGQKDEGWGQEKRQDDRGAGLWIKAHRFEGVELAGEENRDKSWVEVDEASVFLSLQTSSVLIPG